MNATAPHALLILNAGSSSIKFGIYDDASQAQLLAGQIRDLGAAHPHFTYTDHTGAAAIAESAHWESQNAIPHLVAWLGQWIADRYIVIRAVAHRIVSARRHTAPLIISEDVLEDIEVSGGADPEHALTTIQLIRACIARLADTPQIALFDSAFHSTLPDRARLLPIPERYRSIGVERYGFHGLSYASIMAQLSDIYGQKVHDSKVIIAHLGNGSSLAAIENGVSIDTTMSFSPTGGIPMSTRSGDLDPSVVLYMLQQSGGDVRKLTEILNNESGLKTISGVSGDMSVLVKSANDNHAAQVAVEFFCYQVRKAIGAYAAALDGVEVLVFTGGIGEHLAEVRAAICDGLGYMGIRLDGQRNANNERELSPAGHTPMVLMLPSQEERIMTRLLHDFIQGSV